MRQLALFCLKSLVGILVLVGLAECIARVFSSSESKSTSQEQYVVADSELRWKLKSFASGDLRTNEIGFRDNPLNKNAAHTVLLLGDSVSWGDGITDLSLVYPQVAERALSDLNVEIINASVPGYSAFQHARYLELQGSKHEIDLLVLQICLNDIIDRFTVLPEYGASRNFLGIDTLAEIKGVYGLLLRNSRAFMYLVQFLQARARIQQDMKVEALSSDSLDSGQELAWQLYIQDLNRIRGWAESQQIPLLFLISPYQYQIYAPAQLSQPQKRLLSYARINKIPSLDLLPLFSVEYAKTKTLLFQDANHFSKEGHALAAQAFTEFIRNNLQEK